MRLKAMLITLTTLLFLGTLVSTAVADPRMEVNANNTFCHGMWSFTNDDDEIFFGDCSVSINVDDADSADGTNTATGVAKAKGFIVNNTIPGLNRKGDKLIITNDNFQGDEDCTMVETNNTEYTADRWVSVLRVVKGKPDSRVLSVSLNLTCADLADQIEEEEGEEEEK